MHIPNNLILPFVLIPLTLASPTPSSSFFLKTHSSDASKDNLYLSAYHITPGVNDAVLDSDKTHAIVGSLNDTAVVYPSGPGVAYGLNLIGEAYTRMFIMIILFFGFVFLVFRFLVLPTKSRLIQNGPKSR